MFCSCLFAVPVFAETNKRCYCTFHEIGEAPSTLIWFEKILYEGDIGFGTIQTVKVKPVGNLQLNVNDLNECLSVAQTLKSFFKVNLDSAQCSFDTCVDDESCTIEEETGDVYKKEKTTGIKWTIDPPSEEETPIKVDLGEKKEVTITVTGAPKIKFGLENPGEGFTISNSGNTAIVTLDTAKAGIVGLRQVEVYAADEDNLSDQLSDDLWFFVGANCSKLIVGLGCKTPDELKICETKCNNEYCELDGDGACVKKVFGDTGAAAPTAESGLTAEEQSKASVEAMQKYISQTHPVPDDYVGALPDCAFDGSCRKVSDLVQLIVNFGAGMFAIMGSFAFAFFVYGGFTMIVSMGNAEKQKKGMQILVAAVIGIVIAFSAYMLIQFMLDALGVAPEFRQGIPKG